MARQTYRIRIEGCISMEWQDWFADMEIICDGEQTQLIGVLADSAALYGVLQALANLNLPLISVERAKSEEMARNRHRQTYILKKTRTHLRRI